jgi:hypothetical protein
LYLNAVIQLHYIIIHQTTKMKAFLIGVFAALASVAVADDCPEAKQIVCVDDVRAAYEPCKKAAETGGSDMAADLACMKYFNKMKPDCWPCICMIAHLEHMQIKGC